MNQILDYSPNKNSGGNSSRTDIIVRVFAVLLILFAICLLAVGGYGYFKKNAEREEALAKTPTKAKITVDQEEEDIIVKVEHDKVIKEISYNWDNEKGKVVDGNGKSTIEFPIPIVSGDHTLNISVKDIDDVDTPFTKDISSASGEDRMMPTIDIKVVTVENVKKLQVTAKDETAIDYVTYRWNNDEETKEDKTDEDGKEIVFNIDILKGENNLLIVAYDKGGNQAYVSKPFSGVTKPIINIVVTPDKKEVEITCTHENGLKSIECSINSQVYNVEIEEGQDNVSFKVPLEEGNNIVKVKAKSVDNTETEVEEPVEAGEEEPVEDEIKIDIKKKEDDETLAYIEINTSGIIKDVRLNVNEVEYAVNVPSGEYPGLNFDIPIEDGNNVISVTVVTENGTEKTETQEIRR